ncbi:MAG: hypothetical protein C0593_05020 [Marinilabiliales bacterium]|nr:MAG: hypothetical protein C0593_05020 [Marinilabiliales bacterium]
MISTINNTRIIILTLILSFTLHLSVQSQDFQNLTYGTDSTLDVVTWNIEWFPKDGNTTIGYVTDIIDALEADVIAIQEIDDISSFEDVVDGLPDYEGYLESSYFAGLAYIYNTETVTINDIYEIYTTSPYWSAFPRSPMVMDLEYNGERVIIINNHFKCCGDGTMNLNDPDDQETRRYYASNYLKEYIDTHFDEERVIVTGDLNDILTDSYSNNVFRNIMADDDNYYFADIDIAEGDEEDWSYPGWPSHLDHLLITDELFEEVETGSVTTIKVEDHMSGGWWAYEEHVSDHRPVGIRLDVDGATGINNTEPELAFTVSPNPVKSSTTFTFDKTTEPTILEIFNLQGKVVFSAEVESGSSTICWAPDGLDAGTYLAKVTDGKNGVKVKKVLVLR